MNTSTPSCDQKRRSFLKLSGLLGLGVAGAALLPVEKAETLLFGRNEFKSSKTRLAMGTFVDMTVFHPSRDEAENALGLAFAEVDRLCAMLTRYGNSSPVVELNTLGKLENTPEEINEIVARSLYFNKETNGAFDITVKPLVDLFQQRFAAGTRPTDADITETLSIVGIDRFSAHPGRLGLARKGMGITLDGVAPGYIADRAADILVKNGMTNCLVNAGGEIRVHGHAEKGKPWTVAVQSPDKTSAYPSKVALRDGAIATSGNYEIFYDQEKLFHHIVSPKSGHSPHLSKSVTVMAPTACDADILSTAVFVMEPAAGMRYINSKPGYGCFILDANGNQIQSESWPA